MNMLVTILVYIGDYVLRIRQPVYSEQLRV